MTPSPTPITSGVHVETKQRDQHFVMKGHHCHTCFELFYVENGDCRFLIDEHIFDLHTGDFILVPPMVLHYTRYVFGPCKRTVILFWDDDMPDEIRSQMPGSARFFSETAVFQVPEAYRTRITDSLKEMAAEERIKDSHSALLLRVQLQALMLHCSRICNFLFEPPADIHTTDQQILQAAHYICQNYMEPLTSADVAKAAGFSPNYLSRKFKLATGIGLHEYIVFVRLQHAAEELVSTSDSITTIALRCGFSDSNYFKDSFKKKYGVTPRNYRKLS